MCTIGILCFLGTGIGSAVLASEWGGPPEFCPDPDSRFGDVCDSIPLTATNALQCVSAHYCIILWKSYYGNSMKDIVSHARRYLAFCKLSHSVL